MRHGSISESARLKRFDRPNLIGEEMTDNGVTVDNAIQLRIKFFIGCSNVRRSQNTLIPQFTHLGHVINPGILVNGKIAALVVNITLAHAVLVGGIIHQVSALIDEYILILT
ncbi:hypothetical protein D3C81_1206750 [compost metagenome]